MTDIRFYHLTRSSLEQALPRLMEKSLEAEFRVLIKAQSEVVVDRLNALLWTYDPNSFLPHGTAKDGNATQQPIFITDNENNPNNANLLTITDGSTPAITENYSRMLDLFDGTDENTLQAARVRWKAYKDAGHTLEYWQQTEKGWEKKV